MIALAVASPWFQNTTAVPAALATAYDMVVHLLTAIVAGLFAVVAATIIQMAMDEGRERRGKRRAAGTLKIELAMIAEAIRPVDWIRAGQRGPYERRAVPRGAYDGLAGSGMLSGFDTRTQELLYRFYWLASLGDHAGMNAAIGQVAHAVGRVELENAPRLRAALGRTFRRQEAGRMPQGAGAADSVGAPIRGG